MNKSGSFVVDDLVGISLLTAAAYQENKEKYLLVASNLYKAQKIFSFLSSLLPKAKIHLYPSDELIRAENISQSKEMSANRIYVLNEILTGRNEIVIANLASLVRFLPVPELFKNNTIKIKVEQKINLQDIRKTLVEAGYTKVNKIDSTLQFAIRGDILDIFSVNTDDPVRIELFDDEVESIREFDIGTQSSKKQINKVEILPANDFLFTPEELKGASEKIFSRLEKDQEILSPVDFTNLRNVTETDVMDILESNYSPRIYRYFSLIANKTNTLVDYCKGYNLVLVDEPAIKESYDLLAEESHSFLYELFENGRMISHLEMYENYYDLDYDHSRLIRTKIFKSDENDITFACKNVPFVVNRDIDAVNIINSYLNEEYQVNISLSSKEQLNLVIDLLNFSNLSFEMVDALSFSDKAKIGLSIYSLPSGFVLEDEKLVVLTGKELFNDKVRVTRFDNRFKEGTILTSYEELNPGDYVVHEYQGIGQFLELQTLEVDGEHQDYLKLAYQGGEILYVPLNQFHLIRKYTGKEGIKPRLTRLHTKDWERTKAKIKERIKDLAERLFNLYVERSHIEGFSFPKDDDFQEAFENNCEFDLTKDQDRAIKEIKADMESNHPMDRLLCGDVGFGKTEVAFRAAFKAINSGKQVAILCPTTLLARQHYEVALSRFFGFDIKIALFSRLVPMKKQNEYIREIRDGNVHLVIGTHRLLSKEIVFKDLGLLIVDEEQRFGVEQKEKIKELKTNVDVLTLTATPIPRTLQISLLGVRSLSQINTPPKDRMPIQTYVTPYRFDVVKELITRELGREGQVFYLHNRVETIYQTANRLQRVMPEATISVIHGKMDKDSIEDTMLKFYSGEIQVLVCTSIIENGIDVPNANMIIVEDSERYGLAQLYQIKGRVGRGDRIAYAYLMYNDAKVLKEDTQKRLKALQDFSALGSGYKIAQRDLMIRGAGDILGPEQAGFIDSIGLDMYIKLLNEAVQEKVTGKENKPLEYEVNLNLKMDAYIPEAFANDQNKIELYQDILSASSTDSLLEVKNKMIDMYGKLPQEVELLFLKRNIHLLIQSLETASLKEYPRYIEIMLGDNFINIKGVGNLIFEALIPYLSIIKISYINHRFKIIVTKKTNWIYDIEGILKNLKNILDNNVVEVIK
ncbi:MAG: transcription-repair coupling factor [Bacilli bacterium]|nr:transcription-repair coupling factor [Bacilli bacterium]